MARPIDYDQARDVLNSAFSEAESAFRDRIEVAVPDAVESAIPTLFASPTQAYREVLVGCALARCVDASIDVRLPYASHGDAAFNGRTLDERVVNPFFQDKGLPCSRGPYLSVFRRSVRFARETEDGVRDKAGFRALLTAVEALATADPGLAKKLLVRLLVGFVDLRDKSNIPLRRLSRMSIEQFGVLVGHLLSVPSGGLMPVLLTVAMFRTLKDCFALDWDIEWQGINVADRAAGAGGDITVRRAGQPVFVVEVTERPIERERVVSTFNTKIAPNGLDDYLFFYSGSKPTDEARVAAERYFAQGHDINFASVREWMLTTITTIGPKCRAALTAHIVALLSERGVPAASKHAWNEAVGRVTE